MLARKTVLILGNNMAGAALGLVAYFFIGRYMSPEALGMLGVAMAVLGLLHFLGSMGFDHAHVKRLSEGKEAGDALATYAWVKVALTALFLVAVLVIVGGWEILRGFTDSTSLRIIAVLLVYQVLLQVRHIPQYTFNAFQLTARAQAITFTENIVRVPATILVALYFGFSSGRWVPFRRLPDLVDRWVSTSGPLTHEEGGLWLAAAWTAGAAASAVVGAVLLRRHRFPWGRYNPALARSYARFALPIALLSVFLAIAAETDKLMVGFFWGPADAGYYVAAQRYASVVYMLPVAATTLLFPTLSQAFARGDAREAAAAAARVQRVISLAVCWFALFPFVYAAEGIHVLMSDAFLGAAPVLSVLALWAIAASFTMVGISLVQGMDRPKLASALTAAALGLNIGLNAILIPDSLLGVPLLGMRSTGAAVAILVSQVAALALLVPATRRLTGRSYIEPPVAKHLLAFGGTALLLHLTRASGFFFGLDRWFDLAWAFIVGSAVYAVLLALLGELRREDVQMIRDVMNPKAMASYVRDEMRPGQGRT